MIRSAPPVTGDLPERYQLNLNGFSACKWWQAEFGYNSYRGGALANPLDNGLGYFEGALHFFDGNGQPVTIPFSSVDPEWGVEDLIDSCSYAVGVHKGVTKSAPHETLWDWPPVENDGPGSVEIIMTGDLTVKLDAHGCKIWRFSGRFHSIPNEFDFNAADRGFPREQWTTFGRWLGENFGGEDFIVNIEAERKFEESGKCKKSAKKGSLANSIDR